MYELEKSDLGIVAKKPTNKAGQPVAESVERRPGTEGNANQQSTLRTQSRDRVTCAGPRMANHKLVDCRYTQGRSRMP